jgi:hypothetical protein
MNVFSEMFEDRYQRRWPASVSQCHMRSQHGTGSNVNEIRGQAVWKRATCVYKSSSGYITNCRMQF